jgi:hypothetical protein
MMIERNGQRGEGKVGFLIAIIVIGIAIFLGAKIIPVRVAAYEFRDVLREETRHAAVRYNDEAVAKRIMKKAKELEVPLSPKNLRVQRTTGEMIVTASYEQTIDLKVTKYVYKFSATERAPLF